MSDEGKIKDEQELLSIADSMEERRGRVKEMMFRGVPVLNMAQVVGACTKTIRTDIAWVKENMRKKYRNFDPEMELGEVAEGLDIIARRAAFEAEKSNGRRDKNAFMNTAIRAWVAKAHVLSDPGSMPAAAGGLGKVVTRIDAGDYEPQVRKVLKDSNSRRRLIGVINQIVRNSKPKLVDAKIIDPKNGT